MRRAVAVALWVVIGFWLMLPAFASSPVESRLPACCRRDGKHHCLLGTSSARRGVALGARCSQYLALGMAAPHVGGFSIEHPAAVGGGFVAGAAVCAREQLGYRALYLRSQVERGPPVWPFS